MNKMSLKDAIQTVKEGQSPEQGANGILGDSIEESILMPHEIEAIKGAVDLIKGSLNTLKQGGRREAVKKHKDLLKTILKAASEIDSSTKKLSRFLQKEGPVIHLI